MTTATSIAPNVSSTVAGKYVASFCATGCVSAIDVPRSPCSSAPRYLHQLHPPRLVEAVLVGEQRDLLRAGVFAQPDRDRIARDQVQKQKADQRDREQHQDEPHAAVDDEREHRLSDERGAQAETRGLRVEIQPLQRREIVAIVLQQFGETRRALELPEQNVEPVGLAFEERHQLLAVAQARVKRVLGRAFVGRRRIARVARSRR